MSVDVMPSRAGRAAAITLALVLLVPMVDAMAVAGSGSAAHAVEEDAEGIRACDVVGAGDPFEALVRLEAAAGLPCSEVPSWFASEVGLPAGSRDVRVDSATGVVGCIVDAPPEQALASVKERMLEAGWSAVPIGGVDGVTFMREEGECRWVMMSCTQVASATSIVFRCGTPAPS